MLVLSLVVMDVAFVVFALVVGGEGENSVGGGGGVVMVVMRRL